MIMPKKQLSKSARRNIACAAAFTAVNYFGTPTLILSSLGVEGPLTYGADVTRWAVNTLPEPMDYMIGVGSIFSVPIMLLVWAYVAFWHMVDDDPSKAKPDSNKNLPLEISDRIERIRTLSGVEPNQRQIDLLCEQTTQLFEGDRSSELVNIYAQYLDDAILNIALRRKIDSDPGSVSNSNRRLLMCSDSIDAYIRIANAALKVSNILLVSDAEQAAERLIATDIFGDSGTLTNKDKMIP
jgi:hypothetical protein